MQCSEQIIVGILSHVSRLHGSDPNDYNLNILFILLLGISLVMASLQVVVWLFQSMY